MQTAKKILNQIDSYCIKTYDSGYRSHLGASIIGHKCNRYLWHTFRWIHHKVFDGRRYRLFNRGHLEEHRFREWLEGCGHTLTDDQKKISDCNGHFGGSCDGIIDAEYLAEFKTNGTGSGFSNLFVDGVKQHKPQHFSQMCVYGYKLNLPKALYFCINKNDDDLYIEEVELDFDHAKELIKKANKIINSTSVPKRMSEVPSYYECKWCDYRQHCHYDEPSEVNCRSCVDSIAVEDKQWFCKKWNAVIPKENIQDACNEWKDINK